MEPVGSITLRHARPDEAEAIARLISDSSWGLLRSWYSDEQLRIAVGTLFGVDRTLIDDGTYFVAEDEGRLVGCGGWSGRDRLFGAADGPGAATRQLDPAREPARIRAFFVHPASARRGIGRLILARSEQEARGRGFRSFSLLATLDGAGFYRRAGYVDEESVHYAVGDGLTMDFVRMGKAES